MGLYRLPFYTYLRDFLDSLIPPRRSERILRRMTLGTLGALIHRDERAGVTFLLPYRNPQVTALVWELKYRRNPRAISFAASLLAEELLGEVSEELSPPLIIPLPMWHERKKARGFNQTEEMCVTLTESMGKSVVYAPKALERIKDSPSQQSLSRKRRLTNMQNSMRADSRVVRGRTCIVIDDVVTTGATLKEAKRALLHAGASRVKLFSLAG